MQTAETREHYDVAKRWRLDWSAVRRVLLERQMRPHRVVVLGIVGKHAFEMTFPEDDHMVQAVSANGANDAFGVRVLPG